MVQIPLTADSEITAFGRDLGTGPALPATGPASSALRRGDAFYHSTYGALFLWNGTAWRSRGPGELTKTQRTALAAGPYSGFQVFETDTGRTWQWTGTFWQFIAGTKPNVVFHLTTGAGAIPNNSWTQFGYDTIDYDPWGCMPNAQTYRVPLTGLYQLSAMIAYYVNATGGRAIKWMRQVNGAGAVVDIPGSEGTHPVASAGIGSDVVTPARLTLLTAGDLVTVWTYQSSGVTLAVNGNNRVDEVSTATITFIEQTA